jgi:hypothetical protein
MRPHTFLVRIIVGTRVSVRRIIRPAASLTVAVVVAACGSGSTPAPIEPSAPATSVITSPAATGQAASVAPSAAPIPSSSPSAFTSRTYGYSLAVPAGWTTVQAMIPWDGKGAPGHDVAEVDQFISPSESSAWFYGAPTGKDLAGRIDETLPAQFAAHGDTCPAVPESQDPIQIGGQAGVLLAYDCGILINIALTVRDGAAYHFGFRDPAIHAATDPTDRATFLSLLESVKFPA